jgi:hypothetical protein
MVTITQGTVDLGGDTLYVQDVVLGNSSPGTLTGSVDIMSTLGSGTGTLQSLSGVSVTSTGLTAVLTAGSATGGWGIYTGLGTPTGLANRSSLYVNTATTLTASTILYANTNGTATGWVAVT